MACCSRCPSTNLTHVKIEAPTNALSCCRQSDLIHDINQEFLSCPTFGKRDFRENSCAAPWQQKVDLLELSEQTRRDWFVTKREMNGSGSIRSLPSDCFLSDAFVDFLQKVAVGHVSMFQTVTSFQGIFGTGFKPSRRDTAKGSKPQQRAAKPKQPPAPRRRWRESISPISCSLLLLSFFSLGI